MLSAEELESAKFTRRMESPEERWAKLAQCVRFTNVQVPMIFPLLQTDKRIVTVRNGQIATEFSNVSSDKFYYRSDALYQLEGKEFIAVTPDRETLYLFNRDEGFVCAVPRLGRVAITDQAAIVRQSGIVNRARQAQRDKVESFLADRKNTFAEIDVHNAKILAENAEIGTQMAAKAKKQASKISQDTAIEMLDNMSAASDDSEDFNAIASLESFTENQ